MEMNNFARLTSTFSRKAKNLQIECIPQCDSLVLYGSTKFGRQQLVAEYLIAGHQSWLKILLRGLRFPHLPFYSIGGFAPNPYTLKTLKLEKNSMMCDRPHVLQSNVFTTKFCAPGTVQSERYSNILYEDMCTDYSTVLLFVYSLYSVYLYSH